MNKQGAKKNATLSDGDAGLFQVQQKFLKNLIEEIKNPRKTQGMSQSSLNRLSFVSQGPNYVMLTHCIV